MEVSQQDSKTMDTSLKPSLYESPLGINCEDAMLFVINHISSTEYSPEFEARDLTSLPNSAFLERVSEMMLIPALTECIGIAFYPVLPDLVGRWGLLGQGRTEQVACALARLIPFEPRLQRYFLLNRL